MEEKGRYTARQLAVLSLCRLEREGRYGNLEADAAIRKFGLSGAEKALYTKLFYGVLERRITLDHVIAAASDRKMSDMTTEMKNILRVSVYQILYLDRVPDHSAVYEGAELAKKYERNSAAGFVNAVLRRVIKNGPPQFKRGDDLAGYLSLKYSVDRRIAQIYIDELGEDGAEKMLSAMLHSEPPTIRVNTLRTTAAELSAKLAENGIGAEHIPQSDFGLKLTAFTDTAKLFGVIGGLGYIENGASQAATVLLDARPGMTVADVCAAPGGKTVSAAIQMKNEGVVYAFDLHENKLKLIEKTAAGLGVDIIKTAAHDGREPLPELIGKCDRVICDVPCTGLGVLGQKPDMRYKDLGDTERLNATQKAIAASSAKYLKPGGLMVYSTCTIVSAENRGVVDALLAGDPEIELICDRTYYPHTDGVDGFYTALIRRKQN
ncbi:MAG: 16S rRNA (cytosine(967)-C(5))-methyltransferase RsmB [Clostridia bacterium]|nr:16S rRNA (cytosine(967)-C(5))-methyltransferase RsmB [Clostridia bacterium]